MRGCIGYKCILVALVTVVTQIVTLHHSRLARLILVTGVAVQLLVVAYSAALLHRERG